MTDNEPLEILRYREHEPVGSEAPLGRIMQPIRRTSRRRDLRPVLVGAVSLLGVGIVAATLIGQESDRASSLFIVAFAMLATACAAWMID